jgi:drug/metabolite transporter (DMT)-like permease
MLLAAFAALAGNFLLSLGMILQKRHVGWIGHKGSRDEAFRRARRGWLLGFTLMNAQPVFNFVALLGLPPNVVGAAAGSNVAFTAVLASLVLGERIGARRLAWTCAMFAAMAVSAFAAPPSGSGFVPAALFASLAPPLLAAAVALPLRRRRRGPTTAVVLAAVAGSLGGFMVLPMRALQISGGGSLAGWLGAPWLWLYILAGVGGFSIVQLAYKDGRMSTVAPAYYGMQVLWPALASYFVFASPFAPVQGAAFAAIAVCTVIIARQ